MSINTVAVVTSALIEMEYSIGEQVSRDSIVTKINLEPVRINGDPFDHYVVRDQDNKIMATINCMCPCVVTYD